MPVSLPTVSDIRAELEGYAITASLVSDAWITSEMNDMVLPYIEKTCRTSLSGLQTVTEYYSGNGQSILFLNRRNIIQLISVAIVRGADFLSFINIDAIDTIASEGLLKARTRVSEGVYFSIFPKGEDNLKVTYTYGNALDAQLVKAVKYLTAVCVLDNLEGRTGGGNLSTEGWSRDYGNMGKYSNVRKRLANRAEWIMNQYRTGIVGA
jgi:hypothetical protein